MYNSVVKLWESKEILKKELPVVYAVEMMTVTKVCCIYMRHFYNVHRMAAKYGGRVGL